MNVIDLSIPHGHFNVNGHAMITFNLHVSAGHFYSSAHVV